MHRPSIASPVGMLPHPLVGYSPRSHSLLSRTCVQSPWLLYKRWPLYRNKAGRNRRSLLFLSYVTFGGCWWLGGSQGLPHDPSICCGSPLRCWPMAGSWAFQGRVRLVFGGVLDHQKCYAHRVFCTGSVAECARMYATAKNQRFDERRELYMHMSTLIRQRL